MEVLRPTPLASFAALERWNRLQDHEEGLVVQRTFLAVRPVREVALRPRRAVSAPPPPGACDRDEETLAALTNKPPPVPRAVASRAPASSTAIGKGTAKLSEGLLAAMRRSRPEELEDTVASESTATPDSRSEEAASEVLSLGVPASVTSAASSQVVNLEVTSPTSSQDTPAGKSLIEALVEGSRELTDEDLLSWVPHTASGMPTSIGSLEHADGTCKPCLFAHHASKACANGLACLFCHFEHPPKRRVKNVHRQRRG
mmetsp:Transcript_29950/g.81176  ORF Transcript_29950/g.81176 Transcript_29950/m.81176 type:complete len:258 (-) Transcript_29950:280-1053(-)